jgi:hypothetical protein
LRSEPPRFPEGWAADNGIPLSYLVAVGMISLSLNRKKKNKVSNVLFKLQGSIQKHFFSNFVYSHWTKTPQHPLAMIVRFSLEISWALQLKCHHDCVFDGLNSKFW